MFNLNQDQAEIYPCAYNPETNEVLDYSYDPEEWDQMVASPKGLIPCQVFYWPKGGMLVTDELGACGWFDADGTLPTMAQSVILWSVALGLKIAAQD